MKSSQQLIVSILIAVFLVFGFNQSTFASAKGKELYEKLLCGACHGIEGKGILCTRTKKSRKTGKIKCVKGEPKPAFAMYPKLAGQNKAYLTNQMVDILLTRKRSGKLMKDDNRKAVADSMYETVVKAGLMEKYDVKQKDLKKIAKYLSKVK